MKATVTVLLLMSSVMFAADRRNIADVGEKVDRAAAKEIWAAADAGLNSMTFPQAPAILTVLTNGTQYQVDLTAPVLLAGSCVVGEVINPNGEMISTDTYCVSNTAEIFMELWNGGFPQAWPAGITRFRVLIKNGGSVTEANGYVPVRIPLY